MKKNILVLFISLIILTTFTTCNDSESNIIFDSKTDSKIVTIRLAGSDGRTILPSTPAFSGFELTLINGKDSKTPDTSEINGAGVSVELYEGTWEIILKGFQSIDGKDIIAAQGSETLVVSLEKNKYDVSIGLKPLTIEDGVENGLFSFDITLPSGLDTAILEINDKSYDLLESHTGSIQLAPGYYDMSILLKKGNQEAGDFESVHIYSGLISEAKLDLSDIEFAAIVYLAGNLGGIRIGTIEITDTKGNVIDTKELNDNSAKRSNEWLIAIPAVNIGNAVTISQKFNGEIESVDITSLDANGIIDINLTLNPASAKYINLAEWYSEKNGTVLNFGFDVTVNFIKVIKSGTIENIILDNAVTKQAFDASEYGGSTVDGFELYIAEDRSTLIAAINAAQTGHDDFTNISGNGKEYKSFEKWVTASEKAAYQNAINTAKDAKNNPTLTEAQISNAEAALAAASSAFENAKKPGTYMVDKSPLESAIVKANEKMEGVTESADGKDVLNTNKWATPEAFTALKTAIAEAQAYINATNNNDNEQSVVDIKVTTLNNAATTFTSNTQNGKLIETGFNFKVTFNQPQDETITLSATQTISWVKNEYLDINVTEQFDSYTWFVDGKQITGNGNSIRIFARDYSITTHTLTIKVTKNGAPYTKTLYFTVN